MAQKVAKTRKLFSKILFSIAVLVLAIGGILPLLSPGVHAAQITSRSLTISSGVPSATGVTYTFGFSLPTAGQVEGLKFLACTAAVGTCTAPSGLSFSSATFSSQSSWHAVNFAVDLTGGNDCTAGANVLCAKRTDTTSESGARTIAFATITNPSTANSTFFVRITTYTTNTWTVGSIVDTGTTASAVVQTLTINAAVAEVLNFCVGSTTVDDATTSVATDCTGVSGTSLNIGTLDTSTVNVSPVSTNGGDSKNGVAMLRTNALNGATISYDAIQQSGTNHQGTLRISGASCNSGTVSTDQCINAAGTTQTTFTAGTENFGMTIGGVNKGSTTAYSCSYTANPNTCKLEPSTNYLGAGTAGASEAYGTSNGFAWDETGTARQIASSSGPVDDEALILKFAGTPAITTPFGSYTAQADFVAVPTY